MVHLVIVADPARPYSRPVATIHRALDLGLTFLDTADMYGPFTNERLVGPVVAGHRDEVVLATKFGNQHRPDGSWVRINGEPEYVRELGIGFVAFAPLSRGLLSGRLTSPDDLAADDLRRDLPDSGATTSCRSPGAERRRYLEVNVGALDVPLTPQDLAAIEQVASHGAAAGDRYGPAGMAYVNI